MNVKDFYYDLPEELIAQTPLQDRSSSRLMVVNTKTEEITHGHFTDILDFLQPGDCLVLNDTRVIPARLFGIKESTGSAIEFVLLKRLAQTPGLQGTPDPEMPDCCFWEVLLRPGKKAKPGATFAFGIDDNGKPLLRAEILEIAEGGNRIVRFNFKGAFEEILDRVGVMPLPPYIKEKLEDPERYQTVYSRENGSAAAPTAGLHFTRPLLAALEQKGVFCAFVTLHVGLGTFRPVKAERVEDHLMHSEYYEITQEACDKIRKAKETGHRVIAVGTTSCRVLESKSNPDGTIAPGSGWTNIFIYPGYRFKMLDGLITNFHLPESTLLMLVSSLAGRELILKAYHEAIQERYRFFSFGDAMFIQGRTQDKEDV